MVPQVNPKTCNGCENCVEICPGEVYVIEDGTSTPVRREDCIECGVCVIQCPTESIELRDD